MLVKMTIDLIHHDKDDVRLIFHSGRIVYRLRGRLIDMIERLNSLVQTEVNYERKSIV